MASRANGFVREAMSPSLIIPPHPMQTIRRAAEDRFHPKNYTDLTIRKLRLPRSPLRFKQNIDRSASLGLRVALRSLNVSGSRLALTTRQFYQIRMVRRPPPVRITLQLRGETSRLPTGAIAEMKASFRDGPQAGSGPKNTDL